MSSCVLAPGNLSSESHDITHADELWFNQIILNKNASKHPNITPAKTSRMWWRYMSNRETATLVAQANIGGHMMYGIGSSNVKNMSTRNARDACPDGKLLVERDTIWLLRKTCLNISWNYLNLSGPIENKSSLIVGRRRRVAALMLATNTISNIRPMSKFICVW